jgi:hypothetical protein
MSGCPRSLAFGDLGSHDSTSFRVLVFVVTGVPGERFLLAGVAIPYSLFPIPCLSPPPRRSRTNTKTIEHNWESFLATWAYLRTDL